MTMMIDRKGFTLIELLIVVVIIGILAAIAIPKFSATREKAYYSAMKSDLKNLASQQEIYYSDSYQYTTDEAALEFTESEGVNVGVDEASGTGWGASATHDALGGDGCAIYYGDASNPTQTPGTTHSLSAAGQILCDSDPAP